MDVFKDFLYFLSFPIFYCADIICKVLCKIRGLQTFFEEQKVNILGFVGLGLSVGLSELCIYSIKLALDNS